jgi:hypothetical protein
MSIFILRDTVPAGLIILRPINNKGEVLLDYALEDYRDFKIGSFVFKNNADLLLNRGIKVLETKGETQPHIQYLQQMGFIEVEDGHYHKELNPHIIRDQNL